MYVDESGDHSFNRVESPSHRYLALFGVWFEDGDPYDRFAEDLRLFKRNHLGPRHDDPVCLHRKDIMQRKGAFGILRDPEKRGRFDADLLRLIEAGDFRACIVVIDKKTHETCDYRTLQHPYHYCLAVLLERYAGWLEWNAATGDVMAESRAGKQDRALKDVFLRTWESGTRYHSAERFQAHLTSKKLKLKGKLPPVPGLELADLLAKPFRDYLVSGGELPNGFGGDMVSVALSKLNRHPETGRVEGFGTKLLK